MSEQNPRLDPSKLPLQNLYPNQPAGGRELSQGQAPAKAPGRRHGGHGLMMLVCCIPMLVIAGVLVVTGVAGSGAIVAALVCTAMMAGMMLAMPGGRGDS